MRRFPGGRGGESPTSRGARTPSRFAEEAPRAGDGGIRVEERTDMGERYLVDLTTGEKVIPGSRRPDGTYRKEIRVRAGYTPLDERRTFQTRQQLSRNERQATGARGGVPGATFAGFPPGYAPPAAGASPNSKSPGSAAAKKTRKGGDEEKKREQRAEDSHDAKKAADAEAKLAGQGVDALTQGMQDLSVRGGHADKNPEASESDTLKKKVRNLKKKLKEIEALQQKVKDCQALGAEQMAKLQRKSEVETELSEAERRLAELEKQ
ncbi:mago binding protein [Besnoitia besnoiti]|uniref:Mago binding protein n=1 Tax=Besnoitia besnoiti TaxID=94643 RepID=A0A2A9MAD0_BESBE|nr:mago binding protein [Besnoitia besnoiti]PFH34154.1 mago binding protein [Besnoitia besnoiti]